MLRNQAGPGSVAAPETADHLAEIPAEVHQGQVVERHTGPFGKRGQFGPGRGEIPLAGLPHRSQPRTARRV
jgi:hypothetical protein